MAACACNVPPVRRNGDCATRLFTTLVPWEIVTTTPAGAAINTSAPGPGIWPLLQLVAPCHTLETGPIHATPGRSTRVPASVIPPPIGSRLIVAKNALPVP